MRIDFPSRLAATSFAVLALTAGGAHAMGTCSGNYSATLLHPLALPTVVNLDLSDNSTTTMQLGQAFTGGMKDAGVAVTGTPTVKLRVTYDVAGQGGSTPGNATMPQTSNRQTGWSSWSGGQMAALQGGITLAMPDIPNYSMFKPQQRAQSALLMLRAVATNVGTDQPVWIGVLQCTVKTTDNLALARELGYLLGGALGHRKSNIAM
jgi:hypothetical protein